MIKLYLLGSFALEVDDRIIHLPTRKMESLLAYLVLHPNQQNRERIAALFWGDSPDELARRSLRTALSALRKEMGEEVLVTDRETVQLNSQFPLWVDAHEIEEQAREILSANHQNASRMDIDLYRGNLLQDFYDEWILEEREYYQTLFINALQHLTQIYKSKGEYQRAITNAQKIVSIDMINEPASQHLIFSYQALGKRSEALKSYEECQRRLQEQLGVEPLAETKALYKQIKHSSDVAATRMPSNLPIPLTSFIGREQEIKSLQGIFESTRLLTLTGVGGCGKTRLAIQLANKIADEFADGVWWMELAAVQEETDLIPALKKTLGIPDRQNTSAIELILNFLHTKQILLVFDNCEHVISTCARVVGDILQACPALKILATSREALSIYGEIAWLVPSLALPPIDQASDILQWESPRLFLERAMSFRPDLQLTQSSTSVLVRICRALEGIPLAIELAAARIKTLSLEQLASRLDDRLALLTTGSRVAHRRQQTLRAAIDWSYELLSEQEQIVIQQLSIFSGSWTLEAAEFVCSNEHMAADQVLDLITRLLDKSLLVTEPHGEEVRYKMLEIIRQYAFEKLQQRNETQQVHDHHTEYYRELLQRVRSSWFTPEHARLIKQFDAEYPNLRVALAWGLEDPKRFANWENGVRLAIDMGPLWNFLAEYNEGQSWLNKAVSQINVKLTEADLESEKRSGLLSLKAKALYECGFLVWFQTYYLDCRPIFLESSQIFEEIKNLDGLAYSNMFLAHSTWLLGQRAEARSLWAAALEQFNQVGDFWGAGMVYSFRGRAERESGNYEQAEWEYAQCLKLFGTVGDGWGLGIGLSHLGMLAFQQGQPERARELFEKRLSLSREHGFRQSAAYSLFLLGVAAWKMGDVDQVENHIHEALAHFLQLGNYVTLTDCLVGVAWAAAARENLKQAAYVVGAIEKADQLYGVRGGFEDMYFHQPILDDLRSRLDRVKYKDELARGYAATLDEVAKSILKA